MKINKDSSVLVYVWIGDKLPSWSKKALKISKKTAGIETILITSKKCEKIKCVSKQYYLEDFYKKTDKIFPKGVGFSSTFNNGFWLKTTERFHVLEQFMHFYNYQTIFHAELDNLIFDIDTLNCTLNKLGKGIFVPRDAVNRGIASLIYINNANSLSKITSFYSNNPSVIAHNDMDILGSLSTHDCDFHSLPTESESFTKNFDSNGQIIHSHQTGGIFDAASIGQYILGFDPKIVAKIFVHNCIYNENLHFDFSRVSFELDVDKCISQMTELQSKSSKKLYNIHVHSKLFDLIDNPKTLLRIVERLNNGKRSMLYFNLYNFFYLNVRYIVARMYKFIIKPLLRLTLKEYK